MMNWTKVTVGNVRRRCETPLGTLLVTVRPDPEGDRYFHTMRRPGWGLLDPVEAKSEAAAMRAAEAEYRAAAGQVSAAAGLVTA